MCNTKEGRALPRLYMNSCKKLGIDIGSTTVKVSIIEDGGKLLSPIINVILQTYRRRSRTCSVRVKRNLAH